MPKVSGHLPREYYIWIALLSWTVFSGCFYVHSRRGCVQHAWTTAGSILSVNGMSSTVLDHMQQASWAAMHKLQDESLSLLHTVMEDVPASDTAETGSLGPPPHRKHAFSLLKGRQQQASEVVPGPVDVVYLWTNGSDPELHKEAHQHAPESADLKRMQERHDELRFGLRSLEANLPWFRRVFIVTNGQVPSWLNFSHPQVTIVPHSSIFPDRQHLPTFNNRAIQSNIAYIPGLSENFILMNPGIFLTAPWSLSDFLGPDGGHILRGVSKAPVRHDLYRRTLENLAKTFEARFGKQDRYEPSQGIVFMQREWLLKMHQDLSDLMNQTSASRVRSDRDILVPAAYQWYVSQSQPISHLNSSDNLVNSVINEEKIGRKYLKAAERDVMARRRENDLGAAALLQALEGADGHLRWSAVVNYEVRMSSQGHVGKYLLQVARHHKKLLQQLWTKAGSKATYLTDHLEGETAAAQAVIDPVINLWLGSLYPSPSRFELLKGTNTCRRLPTTWFGDLPSHNDIAAACSGVALADQLPQ